MGVGLLQAQKWQEPTPTLFPNWTNKLADLAPKQESDTIRRAAAAKPGSREYLEDRKHRD
jgi:hypothetical protein